ncbi:hypothetical protein GCM10025862_10580 [Arsenicicoccus piscis]|uniref:DUF1800 domain-containing protein n=2 Tax=Arsenicicoccus piscis TaxID=673954 RepID=A0ABQ6HM20_9MICO|nr:hypothetical protein GCM10025862_10580 [Arsenicicoccus piscis]
MPNTALVAEIKAMGIGPWFEAQLLPETVPDPVWAAIEAKSFPWMSMTVSQQVAATGQEPWRCSPVLAQMLAVRPLYTKRVLQESMVELWSDQIYVARGGDLEMWVADFNHRVLRKHALGRFTDLLHAALTNPALLMYLNNDLNRKSGPNENLGRELLELYTVGVGNYTETDVVNSSIILTGHSIDWTTYDYSNAWWSHKTGPVRVMEFSHPNPPSKYDSQTSTAETNAALLKAYSDYLARHRKTAERIARRIAVRFVSDTPSAALVTHLADVYQQNDTAIVPVLRALFNHAEFAASAGLKWKRPLEHQGMLVAATRPKTFHPPYDFRVNPWWPGQLHDMIANAGQPLRMWPAVNGFPDVAAAWLSTASLLNGLNGTESEMEFWDESFDKVVWADALGVKAGMNVWAAADLIATTLTGFTWPRTHLAHIASYLAAHGDRPATDTDVVSADARRWYVPHVVRLVAMSPYAWMR